MVVQTGYTVCKAAHTFLTHHNHVIRHLFFTVPVSIQDTPKFLLFHHLKHGALDTKWKRSFSLRLSPYQVPRSETLTFFLSGQRPRVVRYENKRRTNAFTDKQIKDSFLLFSCFQCRCVHRLKVFSHQPVASLCPAISVKNLQTCLLAENSFYACKLVENF